MQDYGAFSGAERPQGAEAAQWTLGLKKYPASLQKVLHIIRCSWPCEVWTGHPRQSVPLCNTGKDQCFLTESERHVAVKSADPEAGWCELESSSLLTWTIWTTAVLPHRTLERMIRVDSRILHTWRPPLWSSAVQWHALRWRKCPTSAQPNRGGH